MPTGYHHLTHSERYQISALLQSGLSKRATTRRHDASAVPWMMTPERWAVVEDRLREGWSPEQIAGRSRQQGLVLAGTEWISQHVRADRRAGGDRGAHPVSGSGSGSGAQLYGGQR